jgi:ribonuclease III
MVPNRATQPEQPLNELETLLGHQFADPRLLRTALTHSSLRHDLQVAEPDRKDEGDNERLEFLGDAVVGMLVAESLFRRFPKLSEGALTRLRAALVSRKHLGEVGTRLELGRWLRVGRSEERNGGRNRAVLLANCVEAIAAAIYLDTGLLGGGVRAFVERCIVEPEAENLHQALASNHAIGDYKSALQEYLQARGGKQPEYSVEGESGPDHRKRFIVEVRGEVQGEEGMRALARGSGSTKKKAEQEAARRALEKLEAAENAMEEPREPKG